MACNLVARTELLVSGHFCEEAAVVVSRKRLTIQPRQLKYLSLSAAPSGEASIRRLSWLRPICAQRVRATEKAKEHSERRLLIRLMCRPKGITCRSARTIFLVSPIFGALPAGIKSLTDDCVIESNYKKPTSAIAERENRSLGGRNLLGRRRQHRPAAKIMTISPLFSCQQQKTPKYLLSLLIVQKNVVFMA